ncbi:MAG: SMC-Scp complex subunit ScpB [Acidobacteria bacterium]|nr:SMC-Scp complex subunit ScpB [Acidobacteriota bacterium]
MEPTELRAAIEAILFVSSDPVKIDDLLDAFPEEGKDAVATQLEELKRNLEANPGGFVLEQTAGGWRFATRAEHDPILRKYFAKKGENRMSIAALETLAIIAYRQPVTAPEVSDIRGVNATGVIRTLLERRMIRVSGRKNVVGSPFLYRTTKEFLVHFGLNDIRDLPRLEEFGDLIGESINDDLVAAIHAAESEPQAVEVPLTEGEVSAELAEDAGEVAHERADEVPAEVADEAQDETPAEVAEEASDEVPTELADEASDEAPTEVADEPAADAIGEVDAEVLAEVASDEDGEEVASSEVVEAQESESAESTINDQTLDTTDGSGDHQE